MTGHEITVCIPTIVGRAELLQRAIASVAAQTHKPAAIAIAHATKGEGAPATRDRALAMATTPWVAFLDDDDELKPQHLQRLAEHQADTGADLVYSWFEVVGGTDPFPQHFGQPWNPDAPVQTTITTLVRTDAIRDVGGFAFDDQGAQDADGHRMGEDHDMVLRLNAAGYTISHLPERTWLWHHHGRNTSGLADAAAFLYRVSSAA